VKEFLVTGLNFIDITVLGRKPRKVDGWMMLPENFLGVTSLTKNVVQFPEVSEMPGWKALLVGN
jgi:hypothetical protein